MDNNHPINDLLVKYLAGNLSEAETARVERWIDDKEENRKHFEALQHTWSLVAASDAIQKINVDQEWLHFRQVTAQDAMVQQPGNGYTEPDYPGKRSVVRRLWIPATVAASVLLVLVFGWQSLFTGRSTPAIVQEKQEPVRVSGPSMRHEVNHSGHARQLLLQDGSRITLWNNSEAHFEEPFTGNKRNIQLMGKADFAVAKDSARPFTVYTGDIATTVLGTQFTVSAFQQALFVTVRLYEGKVLVQSYDSLRQQMKYEYVLKPGQEFVFDKKQLTAIVRRFSNGQSLKKEEEEILYEPQADEPVATTRKGSWFMFNNQSLAQVFEQLENMYQVKINYTKRDVQSMYFIGRFKTTDSVETILKQIAILNNLTVTKADSTFTVSKQ